MTARVPDAVSRIYNSSFPRKAPMSSSVTGLGRWYIRRFQTGKGLPFCHMMVTWTLLLH